MKTKQTTGRLQGRILSYARWSSKPQSLGDSERRQIEAAEDWCKRHGQNLDQDHYVDAGVSAYRGKNQSGELGRLVENLKPGDTLLVEDSDRLSRQDWKTAMDFVERVLAKGASIVTLKDDNRITADSFRQDPGCFLRLILNAHLGHAEDVKKSQRVREAWTTKRAEISEGKACRQRLPCWLYHEKTFVGGKTILGAVKVDEAKATVVRQIFTWALQGWGFRRIAQELTVQGIKPISGQSARWNGHSLLATVLQNPAVCGHYRVVENKRFTGEVIKDLFPAVVSERDFYAVAANSKIRAQRSSPARAASACLMTGLCFCPACGGSMSHHTTHKGGKVYKYLRCSHNRDGATVNPDCSKRVNYPAFEALLLGYLGQNNALAVALGQQDKGPDDLTVLRGKKEAAQLKVDALTMALSTAPSVAGAKLLAEAEANNNALAAELAEKEGMAKSQASPLAAYTSFMAAWEAYQKPIADALEQAQGRENVKRAIRDVIERVQFHDQKQFTVTFRGGYSQKLRML